MNAWTPERIQALATRQYSALELAKLAEVVTRLEQATRDAIQLSREKPAILVFYPETGAYRACHEAYLHPGLQYMEYEVVARFQGGQRV